MSALNWPTTLEWITDPQFYLNGRSLNERFALSGSLIRTPGAAGRWRTSTQIQIEPGAAQADFLDMLDHCASGGYVLVPTRNYAAQGTPHFTEAAFRAALPTVFNRSAAATAATGATTVRVSDAQSRAPTPGTYFSAAGVAIRRMYRIGSAVVASGSWDCSVTPPLREAINSAATLDFSLPTCAMVPLQIDVPPAATVERVTAPHTAKIEWIEI